MKLLIDADYIVYKSCASAEYDIDYGEDVIVVGSSFKEAYGNSVRELNKIQSQFFDPSIILFFSDSVNFRILISSGNFLQFLGDKLFQISRLMTKLSQIKFKQ